MLLVICFVSLLMREQSEREEEKENLNPNKYMQRFNSREI